MKKINLGITALSLFAIFACSDDDSGDIQDQNARMTVKLVDAPGDYEEVNIDVQDVLIKYGDGEDEISMDDVNDGIYDLLELTGGASVVLSDDDEIPAGKISQIRLVLGDSNTVVVDGETYPLQTPSAQQSGLKVQINDSLAAGNSYHLTLDFDVEKSIVTQGNGGYLLKPVIRGSMETATGSITGLVLPIGTQTLVTASNGETEISSYTNAAGIYVLSGVPKGTYTLTFEAETVLEFEPIILTDIQVETGVVTTVGDVTFL